MGKPTHNKLDLCTVEYSICKIKKIKISKQKIVTTIISYHKAQADVGHNTSFYTTRPQHHHIFQSHKTSHKYFIHTRNNRNPQRTQHNTPKVHNKKNWPKIHEGHCDLLNYIDQHQGYSPT